jgi:rod shape-determining protein MreC
VGQRLVSYGVKGGAYVPGVPLGTITSVQGTPGQLTRIAKVAPYVDATSLDLVGVVIQGPRENPRDTVLPPKPTASPTAGTTGATGATGATGTATPKPSAS